MISPFRQDPDHHVLPGGCLLLDCGNRGGPHREDDVRFSQVRGQLRHRSCDEDAWEVWGAIHFVQMQNYYKGKQLAKVGQVMKYVKKVGRKVSVAPNQMLLNYTSLSTTC